MRSDRTFGQRLRASEVGRTSSSEDHRRTQITIRMFIVPLFTVLLAAFRTSLASPVAPACADDVHLACTNFPFHDSLNDESFNLLNENLLAEHCSDIIADIECKGKYLSVCDPTGYNEFVLVTDGMKNVLIDLCNSTSDLRKVFHTHSPCIESLRDVYEECILDNTGTGTNDKYDYDGSDVMSNEETIQRLCSFYEPFKNCITHNTRTMCGDSAGQLMEQVIVRAAHSAYTEKCLQ